MRLGTPSDTMIQEKVGKLTAKDEKFAGLLSWIPWLSFLLLSLPLPIFFFALFLTSVTTESAAIYLLLVGLSLGLGVAAGLLALMLLLIYRSRWRLRLRDRLAADGITASEVVWFDKELTTSERKILRETSKQNPLLGDAYRETLAARLTATRIIARTEKELVRVRARIQRARNLTGAEISPLLSDLKSDQQDLQQLRGEATLRLSQAKARLQTIEAAASRALNQVESAAMLRRLSAMQEHVPLVIEMAQLERKMLQEAEQEITAHELSSDASGSSAFKR